MKLDKDIHHRLVNPQPNPTLETNVRNILVALNGRAPYDKLIKMIESIRVWCLTFLSRPKFLDPKIGVFGNCCLYNLLGCQGNCLRYLKRGNCLNRVFWSIWVSSYVNRSRTNRIWRDSTISKYFPTTLGKTNSTSRSSWHRLSWLPRSTVTSSTTPMCQRSHSWRTSWRR